VTVYNNTKCLEYCLIYLVVTKIKIENILQGDVMKIIKYALQAAACTCLASAMHVQAANYNIGTGVYDITGPAAENGFFGFSNWNQQTEGIHTRSRAHAYIVESPQSHNRIVFVSADLGSIFQSVKIEVAKRLMPIFGSTYTDDNIMLSATHTHVAAGGSSHYSLFEVASASEAMVLGGYSSENFEAIVNGIVEAIKRAHYNLAPGDIELVQGKLTGASVNRSLAAYRNNADYDASASETNDDMTLLKFKKDNGKEVGMVAWFSAHPTGFSNQWTLLSADISGYAQMRFEKQKGTDFNASETFVASFASSDLGDALFIDGNANSKQGFQGGNDEVLNAKNAGLRLFDKGWDLYNQGGVQLSGNLDYRHRWADMENYTVDGAFTGAGNQALCSAARGFSFTGGSENGPSDLPGIYEGMTVDNTNIGTALSAFHDSALGGIINLAFGALNLAQDDPCQHPKPVLLSTGDWNWVPETLPFQVFMLGELAIVGAPGEITTQAGRRIRSDVLAQLAPKGVTKVVIAGLSNTYSGYVTTKEEYAMQHYEGASTAFGQYTLAAYRQEFSQLASAINLGETIHDDKQPRDRLHEWRNERPGVVWDGKYFWESFGQVMTNANSSYQRGDSVYVSFRGGHPKNNLRTQDTFLKVQRYVGGNWVTVSNDWDWDTMYKWNREGADRSLIEITWNIPEDVASGTYRIIHQGDWKNGWTGRVKPYSGVSRSFSVN
jgi:neutral ceramidase